MNCFVERKHVTDTWFLFHKNDLQMMIQDQGFICGRKEFNFHYFVYYWFLKSLHFLYRIKSATIKYF